MFWKAIVYDAHINLNMTSRGWKRPTPATEPVGLKARRIQDPSFFLKLGRQHRLDRLLRNADRSLQKLTGPPPGAFTHMSWHRAYSSPGF